MDADYTSLEPEQNARFEKRYRPLNRLKLFWTIILAVTFVTLVTLTSVYYHASPGSLPVAQLVNIDPVLSDENVWKEFEAFMGKFAKSYTSAEEKLRRFAVFRQNFAFITAHRNQGFKYTLDINEFADLTHEEFKAMYVGFRNHPKRLRRLGTDFSLSSVDSNDLPSYIDWNEKKCVTPVKNQQQCGSCWAFAATGAMEGAVCVKTGKLVNLSEQQLVDCSRKEGNEGCSGGEMDSAFQFVIDNGGICSEEDYPYSAVNGNCTQTCSPVATIQGFKDVPKEDEVALQAALAKYGPVSVAIEADQMGFQFYSGGVFDGTCGTNLDHGVLLVGYGHDSQKNEDYWLVKNSWGDKWGDKGYIRLVRHKGKAGQCGILEDPSFPLV